MDLQGKDVLKEYRKIKATGAYDVVFEKYRDPGTKYAFMILEGKQIAGRMIKLNAFRHVQDLVRAENDEDFPFQYDLDECRKLLNFMKILPNPDTGKPLPLMLWQKSFLCQAFGWKNKENGLDRYDRIILSVARTNGKTMLIAGILFYQLLIKSANKYNQDMAYIAPTNTQAGKGYAYLQSIYEFLDNIPQFHKLFVKDDISSLFNELRNKKHQNRVMRMSHESGRFDAFHFSLCVSDESGDDKAIGKIKENNGKITSGGMQSNLKFIQISTAYPDSSSALYSEEKMVERAMELDDQRKLDNYLTVVYSQDSLNEAEPEDYSVWEKSNPLLGLELKHDQLLAKLLSERDSKLEDGTIAEFQNKNLNMWLQTKTNNYLTIEDVEKSAVDKFPFDIHGRDVYVGLDMSHFSDDTALAFNFPYVDKDGHNRYYIYQHSWIPLARSQNNITIKEKQDGINYRLAEKNGYATIADNDYGYIDDSFVYDYLMEFIAEYDLNVRYLCYDAWETSEIIDRIEQKSGIQTFPIRQGTRSLNQPTVDFRKQIVMDNVRYMSDDNIIPYALKNAIVLKDNNGIKIDKDKATSKIDVVDAIINTFVVAPYWFTDLEIDDGKKKTKTAFSGMTESEINDYFIKDFTF